MKRIALLVFLTLVLVPVLVGTGMEIGARVSVQSPSFAILAEWEVLPDLTMGMFLESSLDPIFNPATIQTPSFAIGLLAKYRFTYIHPAFVPYVGVAGSLGLSGAGTTIAVDALAGVRINVVPNLYLFAEAAFYLFPFPNVAAWYDLAGWYKNFYFGFSLRL